MNRLARHGDEMKGILAAILAVALLFPLSAMTAAADRGLPAREAPMVDHATTDRGEYVRVRIGDVFLGVVWKNSDDARGSGVRLFLEYTRFFGAAELVDEQGNDLRTVPLPLRTIFFQEFGRMVEFHDENGDDRFNPELRNRTESGDYPIKTLTLNTGWFLDGEIQQEKTNESASVVFTISATDRPYFEVFDPILQRMRPATEADGRLERISLTFHLNATITEGGRVVPVYRVYLSRGYDRAPIRSEFVENRTVEGRTFDVAGKYDQLIQGWDFAADPQAKLLLASHVTFGNIYGSYIVEWLHAQFGGSCLRDGTFEHCESDAGPTEPQIINRTELSVAEGWQRAGRWYWTSDVTVDGRTAQMRFEIYLASRTTTPREDGALFVGFNAFGAFVYPQGQEIFHDPGLAASTTYYAIAETAAVGPMLLAALQVAVIGGALVPALLLRARARKGRP